jgi:RNA polymerase sigma factor (sigma-70 family)
MPMSISENANPSPAWNRADPAGRDHDETAGILARWIVGTLARNGLGRRADLREDCFLEAEIALWLAETHDPPLDDEAIPRYAFQVMARAVRRLLREEAAWREHACAARAGAEEAWEPEETGCLSAGAPSGCECPDERLVNRLWLEDRLALLRPADRELLLLAYVGEWSDPEIGNILGLSAEAVRNRRRRALGRFRSLLTPPPPTKLRKVTTKRRTADGRLAPVDPGGTYRPRLQAMRASAGA